MESSNGICPPVKLIQTQGVAATWLFGSHRGHEAWHEACNRSHQNLENSYGKCTPGYLPLDKVIQAQKSDILWLFDSDESPLRSESSDGIWPLGC